MHALRIHRTPAGRALLVALSSLAPCAAWADEPSPWYLGASQSFTHDSNVYRLGEGVEPLDGKSRGDNYWSTGLLGGFDQSIGRQRFYGTGNVQYNKYQDHDLGNTSYGLNAGWDWATIENLSGNVNASANQSLATNNGNALVPTNDRNLVRTEQIGTTVRWGGAGRLGLQGDYAHSRVSYSSAAYANSNSAGDTASLGVNYSVNPDLRVGTGVSFTHSVVFDGQALSTTPISFEDSVSNGRSLNLSIDWQSTAQTGVNARLSWTRQTYSGPSDRSFSGLTGSLGARYAPTGKISLNASYSRDAGTNGSFFNYVGPAGGTTITGLNQNNQVSDSFSLGAAYAATSKINVNAGYQYRKSTVANTLLGTTLSEYDDKLNVASLGATYAVTRAVQLSCNLSHEKRDVSSTPGYAYTANVVGCSASLTLR